ncbi:MAG: reprolysin-like metallopeptidase, partial [Flavobacteriales bacterium]
MNVTKNTIKQCGRMLGAFFGFLLFAGVSLAQSNFFVPLTDRAALSPTRVVENVKTFNVIRLNETALRQYLLAAPQEGGINSSYLPLEIPLPSGRSETFGLMESGILSPEVAAQHPEIKSYTGNGLTNKEAVIRLTLTSEGLHIVILDMDGDEVYFEHYTQEDRDVYFNYFLRDAVAPPDFQRGRCNIDDDHGSLDRLPGSNDTRNNTGGTLRTFRLAMSANGEFTVRHGGVASAFARVVNYVATMNVIYRRELSVHLNLVSGTSVIYPNPATDPYTTDDQGANLDENQVVLDAQIGNSNYDVGHLMGYIGNNSGGGVATFESVCDPTSKGRGTSGEGDTPYAQVFFDQLVAHEMGHQFGMSHSYNSVIPVCTTRNPGTSVEPGAGATIMSYGFTCGTDDYFTSTTSGPFLNFHTASYFQADAYINSISCQSSTSTGNTPPVVTMPPSYTIPRSTPFSLTGSADAPGSGDSYTYSWEGTDIGAVVPNASTLNNTQQPPFFRSYAPTASPSRTFPLLSAILDGTNQAKGDKLPSVGITTNLRMTVRDNNAAGGGLSYGSVAITVNGSIGPFLETTNLNGTYLAGSNQTITWSVNGTNTATPNVNILLSIDGGYTYPFTLASGSANDGSEVVVLPNVQTSTARVKVEAVGNIFFDISNFDFTISVPGCTAANSYICPTNAATFDQGDAGLNLGLSNTFGAIVTELSVSTTNSNPAGEMAYDQTASGGTSCSTPWGSERYATADFSVSTTGSYSFTKAPGFVPFSVFVANGYNPASPCAGTFMGSNASGVISVNGSVTLNLTACVTYKLVAWEVNEANFSNTITIAGPGDVYSTNAAPANAGYTYVAVNNGNGQIAAQSASSDFTSLAGGSYVVYGASYKNGGAAPPANAVPAGWIGQTLVAVQASECVVFSSNSKPLTVIAGNVCNITSSLSKTDETVVGANDGTITVTANCAGTCGTLQYALNGGTPQASNVFSGLAPGTYTVVTSNVGLATCSDSQMITIDAAASATCNITSSLSKTDETVVGANDGTITVTANCTGTCGTLQYALNGGTPQAGNVFSGLAPGTYTVVTSNVGMATCSDSQMITIDAAAAAMCNITSSLSKTDETVVGANDGTITVTANCAGTCGTLQYALNGGTPQASNVFIGLAPGTYTIVTSNVGLATCSDSQMITINAAAGASCLGNQVVVAINTDNDPDQVTWEILDASDAVIATGGPSAAQASMLVNDTVCLGSTPASACYGFHLMDSFG